MMMYSEFVPVGWLVHLIACFYFVRPIRTLSYRAILTIVPCVILTLVGCHNLPYFHMTSLMKISLYWMTTIRLVHLIVLSPDEILSLRGFCWKFLWFFIPIKPCDSKLPIVFDLISAGVKLVVNHWIHRWFLMCEPSDSYARMGMFYVWICTGTHLADVQIALVRLVTRNKYTLLSFNNYPFLSRSIREFWGRRYNHLISTLLKESIFEPVRRMTFSSAMIAALTSFIVSGLLHAHVAKTAFGASSPWPALIFFVLQGLACCVEIFCPFTPPKPIGIVLTHMYLLLTASLYAGLFTRAGSTFFALNPPPLLDAKWIPQLPVPHFCPK